MRPAGASSSSAARLRAPPSPLRLLLALSPLLLLELGERAAASCDASGDSQAHAVSWSDPVCGIDGGTDVKFWHPDGLGTGTGTGTVPVGTCCEPTCAVGYKPAVVEGRTDAEATCATGSLAVVCTTTTATKIDCEVEGPRPKKALADYAGLRGVCVVFSALGVLAIGANNYGNAVAIAVASQAAPLRVAATLALVFEVLGALMGSWWGAQNVLFSDVVNLDVFGDNPEILMQAMVCVSMAVALVTLAFSVMGVPVSVTQVTVGGLVGVVNVWQNRVETERGTLAAAGDLVPPGGCGDDGTEDCVDWDTIFVRLYIVGFGAPVLAGILALLLRKCVVGSGEDKPNPLRAMLALLWGFPLLYVLITQIMERVMATSEPPTVTLLRGNQPTETADLPGVKWFNTGIVLTSFSAWDNGGGNPWLAIMIFVLLLFLFLASTIRFCYAIQEGNPPTEITCCGLIPCCGCEPRNVNGCSQVLAWIAWTLFIGSLIIHHLTFQHEWRGGIIRGKYAWAWILLSVTTFAVLVFEVLNLFWYGAPCIGGRSCCERQLGESKSQKQERNPHALAEKSGDDALLFPTRTRPCCPLLVDCCNDEHDQHSRAWRCRIGGCCRRVNHAENPSWFLTHAPPALRDCLCVQTPMEPVRKRGVGQGISYHADSVDQLEALKHDGNECFRAEKYEGAIAAYTAAIEIAPESALAPLFCSRSAAYNKGTKKDDHEQAVEDAQEAIDLGPGTKLLAKAHLRLGEANEELRRYRLARAAFERALELEPENKLHRTALYRVLAEDEQLRGNKKNVLDMIAQYHGGGKDNEEGIPEITMTHADFATLDDLTADLPRDDTFTQTSVKLMLSQTPGVEGGGRSHRGGGGHSSPGGTREKRRMKAEKLVQHAERGARNLSEHQHRQRGGVEKIDLEEQKEYAESNCKEYIEHVEQEARERMADAISRDWSQRVDVEMQSRILAEEKAKRLQSELDETSRLVGDTQATNCPVFVVSSLQTKPQKDLPNVTVENLQQEFNDLWRWPEDIFKQVRLLRAAKQWETEKEKVTRCVGGSQENSEERLPFWILEFEAELHPNESVAANMQRAWEVLRMPEYRRKFEDQNMLTTDPQHRTVELEIEDDCLKIAAFEREDRYQPVRADLNRPVQDPGPKELPIGKKKLLVFTVVPYYWSCLGGSIGTVPTKAIAGQPQPVKHGLDPKVWKGNTDAELGPVGVWKECSVGPSEAVKERRDSHGEPVKIFDTQTTETHRRAAHLVRDTQGGYADLVCISAIVMSFLQGASDFVVSMAPLLILYEVFGDGTDGTEGGGLDWEYACPPARIGLEYDEFSVASAFQDTLSEALSGARRQRRSLLVLETCDESDRICMLQSNLSVSGWWCLLGALFLGVGAILLGHRTLNRLSFELVTSCAPADGFCATTAATLVWAVFLLAGVPLSLTYLTIGAMMGMASGIGVKGPKIHCFSPSDIDKKWAAIGAFVGTGVGLLVGALVSKPGVGIGIGVGVTAFIAVAEAAYHERVKWNRFLVELVVGFLCAGLLTGFLSALLFTFSTAMVPTTEFEPLTWPTLGAC